MTKTVKLSSSSSSSSFPGKDRVCGASGFSSSAFSAGALELLDDFFFFFFFCVSYRLLVVVAFTPTVEVVSFRLRGQCALGMSLLLTFTCLGHECQGILSPCDRTQACTDRT